MLPGELSTLSVAIVWIESITTRSGLTASMCLKTVSIIASHTTWQSDRGSAMFPSADSHSLSARSFSWRALSSPLTYSTFDPLSRRTVCSISVDFPIPGSPPSKVSEPGTSPPPSTLFSSLSKRLILGSSSVLIWLIEIGLEPLPNVDCENAGPPPGLPTFCSLNVFHSPHDGHLPIHFGESYPQLVHTYAILSFAIFFCLVTTNLGKIFKRTKMWRGNIKVYSRLNMS